MVYTSHNGGTPLNEAILDRAKLIYQEWVIAANGDVMGLRNKRILAQTLEAETGISKRDAIMYMMLAVRAFQNKRFDYTNAPSSTN